MTVGIPVSVCIIHECNKKPEEGCLCCPEHMAEAIYGTAGQG